VKTALKEQACLVFANFKLSKLSQKDPKNHKHPRPTCQTSNYLTTDRLKVADSVQD